LIGGRPAAQHSIGLHRRYRHSTRYVEEVLAAVDLRSEILSAALRLEAGDPVAGLVVRARS
jgi:predicted TPR repeat methyltransferase